MGVSQFSPTIDRGFQFVRLKVASHRFLRARAVWKSVANAPIASEETRGFAMVEHHDLVQQDNCKLRCIHAK
ncbi:hypothetical protein PspLS_01114 [Pyricularia sp. CBS 133598]|nr:hypothetical protein PspLS_01114 [Pyricularia sp. CBS 133598]